MGTARRGGVERVPLRGAMPLVDAQLRRDEQRREERLRVVEPGVGVAEARGKARAQREQEGPANQRQPTEARNVNSRHSGREGDVPGE